MAFRFNGRSLTYRELLERSNALAGLLCQKGVVKGDRVGIYLRKSLETPIAVYGTWKAGAAYVPLDPLAPSSRTALLLNDCEIQLLITNSATAKNLDEILTNSPQLETIVGLAGPSEDLPATNHVDFISWDDVENAKTVEQPDVGLQSEDLAYVMYTSGSTGIPKGIMHTHFSGLSYARLSVQTYNVLPTDRLANHAALHFDQSTMEYFAGPLAGATVVIVPEMHMKMPASLSQLIEQERISIWYSVPFALIQLLRRGALEQRDLSSLRWVLFGGEVFPRQYLDPLMKLLPNAVFSNVYGPAEVNQCTFYNLPESRPAESPDEEIPIGRIWPETSGIIVDEQDRQVDDGEIGELLVHSSTMMGGYWRRPDLDSNAFVNLTNSDQQSVRYYRTGDLVRERADGNLVFCGRKDRQIKIRGYRVELDEVELVIGTHEDVDEVVAVGVPGNDGNQQVVVGVLPGSQAELNSDELIGYATEKLPVYAVPGRIWIVNQLPRTGTNKLDRPAFQKKAIQMMAAEQESA